ncbi:MAG: lipoyl synthase [Acidimicrobiia bacterium]|nr:lipoyl synthase [Acidimicrobiia bacterium]NNL28484.1 lipoyl synthase [Acidimicrobiia bacterium]
MLRVRWLGRLDYEEAWDLQRAFWEGRVEGRTSDDYLLLVEHPPTYTVGRNGDGSNILTENPPGTVHFVDRGGDVTYHGPGQLVGYPIVDMQGSRDYVGFVRRLEDVIVGTLRDIGIRARSEEGFTGVWTDAGKAAAIGISVRRGVTMHGFAINVATDLAAFSHIRPCGVDRPVTRIAELVETPVSIEGVIEKLIPRFVKTMGYAEPEIQLGAFTRGSGKSFDVDHRIEAGTFSPNGGYEPILLNGKLDGEPDRPEWMKVKARQSDAYGELKSLMRSEGLNTVCEEAGCPNIYECWSAGTATLMLLGDVCTRACSFCDVNTGKPGEVDVLEPLRAADAVATMGLKHAVLTSVNRDDLLDGGSSIFARTVEEIHRRVPDCDVEVLIPDFKGRREDLKTVLDAHPKILNHNTETVLRLQRDIRTAANYGRSLTLLARAKWIDPSMTTKSGLIVGMGETEDEIIGTLADMRAVGVDIVTIGQYLRPSAKHRPIDRFVEPVEFDRYAKAGMAMGISHVESGPLVRSSYHAQEAAASAT